MISLTFYIVAHFVTGAVAIILGLLVFLKNTKEPINKAFGLLNLAVAGWAISYGIWLLQKNPELALFWSRALNLWATFIPVFYLHWILSLLNKKRDRLLVLFYISTFIFAIFSYSNFYIRGTKQILQFSYWPQAGWLYVAFLVVNWVGIITYGMVLLSQRLKNSTGYSREQIKYVILGSIIGFIGGSTNFLLMLGFSWFPPVGSALVIAYPIAFSYAMFKYHLMGIKVILTELLVGAIAILLLAQFLGSSTISEYVWKGALLAAFLIFGWLLRKSVLREIEDRERLQDLTVKLRKAYKELERLDKAKSEFISIASHQLRTPLTAIKGYISMILEGTYGQMPEKVKQPMENVYKSNERLIKLINDLLNVSRIESGRLEMDFQKAFPSEIITSCVEELKFQAQDKNLGLKWEEPAKETLQPTLIDQSKIRQVILNLIDNAIKYTESGEVRIKCQIIDGKYQIVISDTGAGMTEEELSYMFESFSRGKAGTELCAEGTGLGLYVARKFVEMQGGRVWAESPGKGKGSTFYIELPIK